MDLLKTPHEKLMEDAGLAPQSPGMLNTPHQLLMQEVGGIPHLAVGGEPHPSGMSAQDMLAYLVAAGHLPAHYAPGGSVIKNVATQAGMTLPLMGEELSDIGRDVANKDYTSAALKTGQAGYSAFAPWNPLTALISGMTYSPEAGAGSTLDEWRAAEELRKHPPKVEPAPEKRHSPLYYKTMVK